MCLQSAAPLQPHLGRGLQEVETEIQVAVDDQDVHQHLLEDSLDLQPDGGDGTLPQQDINDLLLLSADALDQELMDPIDFHLVDGVLQPSQRSQWLRVADMPVTPGALRTVRDTAWLIVDQLMHSTTTFQATSDWLRMLSVGGVLCKPHGPHENNRFPPSLDVCRRLLDTPDLSLYERHVCPNGCRWYFKRPFPTPEQHMRACEGCNDCKCPFCHCSRFVRNDRGFIEPGSK
jgi:hypothetical protein